jgi:uncharacterized protein YceH (UPF0502 family)
VLDSVAARVLGCLIEKERTVPDQYPLTANALLSACNQSTSRDPVMQLGEHQVHSAIGSLKELGLARLVHPSHGRSVTRYRHVADERWGLGDAQLAVVAVLLLRGPQTLSEVRTRTERQHAFGSLDAVEVVLEELAAAGRVRQLERQPGQKEQRWQQLLADEAVPAPASAGGPVRQAVGHDDEPSTEWVARRETGVMDDEADALRARVAQLEARVSALEAAPDGLI